jgi:hypothetical protein
MIGTMIDLHSVGLYHMESRYLSGVYKMGVLDTSKERHLAENLLLAMQEFGVLTAHDLKMYGADTKEDIAEWNRIRKLALNPKIIQRRHSTIQSYRKAA